MLNPIDICILGPAREALPASGPEALDELEKLDSKILHRDAQERWQYDLDLLRQRRSFEDITFYLPYLHSQATILDYRSRNGLVILDNPAMIQHRICELDAQVQGLKERLERERENPAHLRDAHLTWHQIELQIQQRRQLRFADLLSSAESDFEQLQQGGTEYLIPPCSSANSYGGRLRAFVQDCRKVLDNGDRVIIVTMQGRRMAECSATKVSCRRRLPSMSVPEQKSTSCQRLGHSR